MGQKRRFRMRSLYVKFLCIFTTTLILVSFLSGVIMYNLVEDYLIDSKVGDMGKAVEDLHTFWVQYFLSEEYDAETNSATKGDPASRSYLQNLTSRMELYSQLLGAVIFIANKDGAIQESYPLLYNDVGRDTIGKKFLPNDVVINLNYYDDKYYFPHKAQFQSCLSEPDYLVNSTDFYGLFDEAYLTVSKRISFVYPETKESVVEGSISIAVPIPEITQARTSVVQYFVVATLIAVLVEVIILAVFTRKLTDPIRSLQEAAARLSSGDFHERIQRTTNDEIGDLMDSFNKMTVALENLDSVRNDFIANVSHELRTPMTSIGGFIEGILDGVIPEERQKEYLERVHQEIGRMNTMVNELLDMARLQAGKESMQVESFNVNSLICHCVVNLEPLIAERELNVETEFESKTEMVTANRNAVERVIINLIQNATKFTPNGGFIRLGTKKNKDKVEVTVADNGIGIAEEDQSLIFERFYKSDKSRSMDKKGTGLGLSIVKKILQAHGEDIHVESKLGEGTKFVFTLPR